jgi:hypothetical protein
MLWHRNREQRSSKPKIFHKSSFNLTELLPSTNDSEDFHLPLVTAELSGQLASFFLHSSYRLKFYQQSSVSDRAASSNNRDTGMIAALFRCP